MKPVLLSFLFLPFSAWATQGSCYLKMNEGQSYSITDYQVAKSSCAVSSDGRQVDQLRNFKSANSNFSWVVDQSSLQTFIVASSCLVSCKNSETEFTSSRYGAVLKAATAAPFLPENDGLTTDKNSDGNYLTIDLCPSSKPYEKSFFQFLAGAKSEGQFPVALAISGDWMIHHKAELNELIKFHANKNLEITWVNHTRHHPYTPGFANGHNFLLRDGVDSLKEIIEQEILMFSTGLQPSLFLRYPGLISNQRLIGETKELGLIPLGSQAWIAKTRKFSAGDILLIHGNGNENYGIQTFYNLVKDNRILNYTWRSLTMWGQGS